MKPGTSVLIFKGFCFALIGAGTPLITNLSQWSNSGSWPERINWVVIIAGSAVGGATQLLSFLSESFAQYKAQPGANGKPALPEVAVVAPKQP